MYFVRHTCLTKLFIQTASSDIKLKQYLSKKNNMEKVQPIIVSIFETLSTMAGQLLEFVTPWVMTVISFFQTSIENTDFNTWNPRSCIWTVIVILLGEGDALMQYRYFS